MGRYLERAEHLSRLMELQVGALVDRPTPEIMLGWKRIYMHLEAQPPGGVEAGTWPDEDYSLADSFTLAGDLTFETNNHYSIKQCFAAGRENARQNRHCVSSEMWTCLNLAYLRIQDLNIEDIWPQTPQRFYAETVREVNTILGVAGATMYRDEGWQFLQIGRNVEHIQLMTSLLRIQSADTDAWPRDGSRDFEWLSLLHSYHADEAYQHYHGMNIRPLLVLNMMVADERLPTSVVFASEQVRTRLQELGDAPGKSGEVAGRFAGRLSSLIRYEWPDTEDHARMLARAHTLAFRLHEQISEAWFDYEIDETARH